MEGRGAGARPARVIQRSRLVEVEGVRDVETTCRAAAMKRLAIGPMVRLFNRTRPTGRFVSDRSILRARSDAFR